MKAQPAEELKSPPLPPGRAWSICKVCDDWVEVCLLCRRCKGCGCSHD